MVFRMRTSVAFIGALPLQMRGGTPVQVLHVRSRPEVPRRVHLGPGYLDLEHFCVVYKDLEHFCCVARDLEHFSHWRPLTCQRCFRGCAHD